MSSTEEDNAVLCRIQEVGLKESEAEVESVVGSVVRVGERVSGGGSDDESGEASGGGNQEKAGVSVGHGELHVPGFGEKQFLMMTALKNMRALLQLGLSILQPVMSAMTLTTWHGRKVIFSRN